MQKKIIMLLLTIVFVMLPITSFAEGGFSGNPKAINQAAKSVLMLQIFDANNDEIATGSGFVAFNNRTIITNYHVIEGADWMLANSDDGYQYMVTKVLVADEEKDIAICEFMSPTDLQPLEFNTDGELMRAESIVAIGSPIGITNTVSLGNISALYKDDGVSWIQFTAPISRGSSGGALLDDEGKVIGVTSASYIDTQNLNLAVHIFEVEKLYNEWDGVLHQLDEYTAVLNNRSAPEPSATPAPVSTPICYFPVKWGDVGELVRLLQERLIELGYMEGAADGIFDVRTEKAVIEFNYQNFGLRDTIAQIKTLRLLLEGIPKPYVAPMLTPSPTSSPKQGVTLTPTVSPTPAIGAVEYPFLSKGAKGADVKKLQTKLIELGYLIGNADGIFGSWTEEAINDFYTQNRNEIKKYDALFNSSTTGTSATNALQQFLYHGNPSKFHDIQMALRINNMEWENLNGDKVKVRFQCSNVAKKKAVASFEIYVYTRNFSQSGGCIIIKEKTSVSISPGSKAYSDYITLQNRSEIIDVYCGIHEITYTDGSVYTVPDQSIQYSNWVIR